MASIGHIAVGVVAARAYRCERPIRLSSPAFWSAVSLLPDLDVVGFPLGVEYADAWGHRGATHSLAMSVVLGLTMGFAARLLKRAPLRTAVIAAGVLASHAVLDTMTDGGFGCALLWPFDDTRFFAPWRPIPVAPIGLAMISPGGASIAMIELVFFGPIIVLALRPSRVAAGRLLIGSVCVVWLTLVWLMVSTDRVREATIGMILREDTAYGPGFSEAALRAINRGDSEEDVIRRLGRPVGQHWFYAPRDRPLQRAVDIPAATLSGYCLSLVFRERRAHASDRRTRVQPSRHRGSDVPPGSGTLAGQADRVVLAIHLEPGKQTSPRTVGVLPGRTG